MQRSDESRRRTELKFFLPFMIVLGIGIWHLENTVLGFSFIIVGLSGSIAELLAPKPLWKNWAVGMVIAAPVIAYFYYSQTNSIPSVSERRGSSSYLPVPPAKSPHEIELEHKVADLERQLSQPTSPPIPSPTPSKTQIFLASPVIAGIGGALVAGAFNLLARKRRSRPKHI